MNKSSGNETGGCEGFAMTLRMRYKEIKPSSDEQALLSYANFKQSEAA